MNNHIEENILNSVREMLVGRMNEILGELEEGIPPVECGDHRGGSVVVPVVALSSCERSEKERIVGLEVYGLTIVFAVPDGPDAERYCYAYAAAVGRALAEDPGLGGVADRAALTGKKYRAPKVPYCGEGWEVVLTLRICTER
jgi:hypothetical protein